MFWNGHAVVICVLAAALAPGTALADSPWSSPETSVIQLGPGMTQKSVSHWRLSSDRPGYRTVESKAAAQFNAPQSRGSYEMYRKQVYHQEKLVTFYRSLTMDVRDSPLLLVE